MTTGLFISFSTKLKLPEVALTDNVPFNWQQYRADRNIFNKTVKLSKKFHYQSNIEQNIKNPKKTWDILRELTTGKKDQTPIEKIKIDGKVITDPTQIANEFNSFFTRVGHNIADGVEPTSREPLIISHPPQLPPPSLRLDNISQHQIVDVISAMDSKSSTDANGISIKLLKILNIKSLNL